jgi:hypothetical protein
VRQVPDADELLGADLVGGDLQQWLVGLDALADP